MEPGVVLLGFCVAMFAGAFLSGYIPLSFGLSEEKLRLITIFGAGLLVGTALIVIIPEGIGMHFSSQLKMWERFYNRDTSGHRILHENLEGGLHHSESDSLDKHYHFDAQWQIGMALAAGFCFQLIIDRISGGVHGHSHGVVVGSEEGTTDAVNAEIAAMSAKSRSAMAGMIVHAAVDGVALGAAMKDGNNAMGFIVFIAIMLHKAPSAFGLSSYLLHHGLSREGVLKRLIFFSFAAPIGTILTYLFLSLNVFVYHETLVAQFLLFSGGTFLYVATAHILPEVQTNSHVTSKEKDEDEDGATAPHVHYHAHAPLMRWSETGILVLGILLPLLINFDHGH